MLEHFNNAIENLGDTLFGEDASPEEFKNFVNDLADDEGNAFLESVKEALLIEAPWTEIYMEPFKEPWIISVPES